MEERKTHKLIASEVKANDLMAVVYYVKVKSVEENGERLTVKDLDNGHADILITGKDLVESALSADQFHEEIKVSKTYAAEVLVHSANRPLTVCFEKQDGTERILKGRLIKPEPLLGRSKVEDLETLDPNRTRLVDHRTLKYLIVDGIKYTVK